LSSEQIAVRAENLGKTYVLYDTPLDRLKQLLNKGRKYGREFVALDDISFELRKGEVLGVIGHNGAGKSTLLQLLCKTLTPSCGQLQVNGRIAALLELGAGFNPEFTGRENIFLNAAVLGLSESEIKARFDEIVDFSGIVDFIDQPVKTYSSGMYVRLAFSIATSIAPDILIIDEALSVGDGAFARKSFDRIMALKASGTTILFCSHSMYHIEAICDRAIWLEKGRMRLLGAPEIVTRAYAGGEKAPTQATSAQPEAHGPARIRSVVVSADGNSGKVLTLEAGQSDLSIEVRFSFDLSLPLPSVAFGLETESGQAVSSGSTVFDQTQAEVVASGEATVNLVFPKIPLIHGRYRLTIFLACERAIHVYDQALYCATLDVRHPGAEQGVCFLPHRWNNGATCLVPRHP
jgi:lipopolysaccharide transport system ATP-binding protein